MSRVTREHFADVKNDQDPIALDRMAIPLLALAIVLEEESDSPDNNAWGVRPAMKAWSRAFRKAYELMVD
jgi:hypothetical protein